MRTVHPRRTTVRALLVTALIAAVGAIVGLERPLAQREGPAAEGGGRSTTRAATYGCLPAIVSGSWSGPPLA